MKSVYDLPVESPFYHEIVGEVELIRASFDQSHDPGDIDFLYAMPLEDDLVDEALRAHDIYET